MPERRATKMWLRPEGERSNDSPRVGESDAEIVTRNFSMRLSHLNRIVADISLAGLTILLNGCLATSPCDPAPVAGDNASAPPTTSQPFVGKGDPYVPGDLAVRTTDVKPCDNGAPMALRIHAPEVPGDYAVVLFQHGFMSRNSAYDEMLTQVSSHGFVVVAPQMYEPGLGPLLGIPTAAAEAEWAGQIITWLPGNLDRITGVHARTDRLGISGHSRGGKVAWLVASSDPTRFRGIAGVDPVDGTGGPLGNQPRVVQGQFEFDLPSLVIGTEMGGSCAPLGDNHVQFYEASRSPAWHIVALGQGHGDMLDEEEASAAAMLCASGTNRAGMRRLTAGLLVSFFRAALQGDADAYGYLSGGQDTPIMVSIEKW